MTFITQITQIKMLTTIRRTRTLPRPGNVVVRRGQEVSPVQVVARTPAVNSYHILRASDALNVAEEELDQYLLVAEGEELHRGTPLMRLKPRFGQSRLFQSPVDGILREIQDGCLIIQEDGQTVELRALIRGVVATTIPEGGVVIETNGTLIQGAWDSGHDGYGILKNVSDSADEWLDSEQIDTASRGSVLVAGRVDQGEVLERIRANDVRGLIVGSMPAELCRAAREFSFPTIVTDGAGIRPMTESIFNLLRQSDGREVSLLARENGVRGQRTEIIIPLPTAHLVSEEGDVENMLKVGKRVRILSMGHESTMGEIVRLHQRPRKTPGKLRVQGADVRRADGSVVFVPYTNIDLIRE